jgi:hypothetical protein
MEKPEMQLSPPMTGVMRYEFVMQARRPALWIGMACFCAAVKPGWPVKSESSGNENPL